jgi:uncharacterized membrane protein YfcA
MPIHPSAWQFFGLIALGFGVGAYSTIIGAGGGFLLMPILLILYPHDQAHILTCISLAVVFVNSLSGASAYAHLKRIDYRSGLMLAAVSIPGAVFGALGTAQVPRRTFEGIFGVFLLVVAVFMILRTRSASPALPPARSQPAPHSLTRVVTTLDGTTYKYTYYPILGLIVFFFLAFLSGFLGIGGGSLFVPLMAYLLYFPVVIATATSQFIVGILSLSATLVHIWTGSFQAAAPRVAALGIGVLIGAQMGALLSKKITSVWIIRSLALALTAAGLRLLFIIFKVSW